MILCAVAGCDRATSARGWCKRHYEIWRRHGDAGHQVRAFHGRSANGEDAVTKLHRKSVLTTSGCREWTGWRDAGGYGRIAVGRQMKRAHVVAWEAANGRSVPNGMVVRHRCDNPSCVQPSHLLIGTQAQNVADMIGRGRIDRSGERNNAAKLTAQDVVAIRAKHTVGQSITNLSAEFGVSVSQVKNIVNNKQWKEVS